MAAPPQTVVILGAGINGAALARELVLNAVPVVVVDKADLASGSTAYSSRLIHGGLRYLEYGEFSLVRESLEERNRLLRLAPHFVHPLEIVIPVGKRFGGWLPAVARFLGRDGSRKPGQRGLWLVRSGLWLYDRYARDPQLPHHSVRRVTAAEGVPVDPHRYRWLCGYWDARIPYPERFVLALLEDARALAAENGIRFELFTYHHVRLVDRRVEIRAVDALDGEPVGVVEPAAIVNATGAWVDRTLSQLQARGRRLIGGTTGSHFLTFNRPLREAIGAQGLYAEADDGRPVFVLPFARGVLVGTTDLPFDRDPATATATEEELDYLLGLVRRLLPQIELTRDDLHLHYAGVRPLPFVGEATPGSITRRHWLEPHPAAPVPMYSIIGGKLTTCRSLAEQAAGIVLRELGGERRADSRERPIPGAEAYPEEGSSRAARPEVMARRFGWSVQSVEQAWSLLGSRCLQIAEQAREDQGECLAGTALPISLVRWIIEHEWVTSLDDLIERRLMLLYDPALSRRCLQQLAGLLVEAGRPIDVEAEVAATVQRLRQHFGKSLADEDAPRNG
jgi:glycerol-3-phosphate dehydrogenase